MSTTDYAMRHYDAIFARAAELGLPKSYRTDLTKHDRQACQMRDPREPFGWSIGECGTHLFSDPDDWIAVGRTMRGQQIFWHYWDGVALHSVASAELLAEKLTRACSECGEQLPDGETVCQSWLCSSR